MHTHTHTHIHTRTLKHRGMLVYHVTTALATQLGQVSHLCAKTLHANKNCGQPPTIRYEDICISQVAPHH